MMRYLLIPSLLSLTLTPLLSNAQYTLAKDYFDTNFFDNFDFFSGTDPTHGTVLYQGRDDSLIRSSASNAQMHVSTEQSTPNGRPSIRITSECNVIESLVLEFEVHG